MGPGRITKILVEGEGESGGLDDEISLSCQRLRLVSSVKTHTIQSPDRPNMGKDTLHLLNNKGEFLKPCPGTSGYICCGYQILNLATNCPLDCTYCILQHYFNQPNLRVFANLEQGLQSALKTIDGHPERVFRVGTGEFTNHWP